MGSTSACIGGVAREVVSFGDDSAPGALCLLLLGGAHVVFYAARVDLKGEQQPHEAVTVDDVPPATRRLCFDEAAQAECVQGSTHRCCVAGSRRNELGLLGGAVGEEPEHSAAHALAQGFEEDVGAYNLRRTQINEMSSTASTSVPFEKRFAALRRAQGLSLRHIAQRTKEVDATGKGLSPSYLGSLATGAQPPSSQALQLIAGALDVSPDTFVEYRLASIRAAFDERQIGVAEAARHLEIFEAGMTPTLSRALFDAS